MTQLYGEKIRLIRDEAKKELENFMGGKWAEFWEDFDDMEWFYQNEPNPFQEDIARNLNNWILNDDNLNLKN